MKIEHFLTKREDGIRLLHFKMSVPKITYKIIDWEIYCDDKYTLGTIDYINNNILTVEVTDESLICIRIATFEKRFFKFVNIEKETKNIIPVENITMELEEVSEVHEVHDIEKRLEIIAHGSSSDEDDTHN
jgi:hypothetical protein